MTEVLYCRKRLQEHAFLSNNFLIYVFMAQYHLINVFMSIMLDSSYIMFVLCMCFLLYLEHDWLVRYLLQVTDDSSHLLTHLPECSSRVLAPRRRHATRA